MSLQVTQDCNLNSGSFTGGCSDANYVYAVTNVPDFRLFNWTGALQLGATALSLAATPTAIVLGTAASAVINYSSARVSIVDTLYNKTDITTNALATFASNSGQQSAPGSGVVMSTTSTNSKVLKTDPIAQTCTQLSPTPLSTHQASCIIFKADTLTWLIGTNNGLVFEMDKNGNQIGSSLTLVTSPNISAPTIIPTGLSYYNNILVVVTNSGNGYIYSWTVQTLLNTFPTGANNVGATGNVTCSLTDSASGVCLVLSGGSQSPNSTNTVTELFFNTVSGGAPILTPYYNEAQAGPNCGGIQPTITSSQFSKAWVNFADNNAQGVQLRFFNISSPNICSETTRFQNPIGTDIASRCIRIRDEGIGRSTVEIDQNVSSGTQAVNCTSDRQYIEINIASGQWDIREFST